MADVVIEFKEFGFQYNAQAEPTLKNINLSIKKGEKVLIAGPSGSGKSTLAQCINGLIPFSYPGKITGTLSVCGIEPQNADIFTLSKYVGTVLQDPDGQFIGLTVAEDIAFSLENDCVDWPELGRRTKEAAGLVQIENRLLHSPYELSGGQKQRVSLAGVIVDDVKILLFDEPLANLDPYTGKQAIDLIDRIQRETDTTVVIIEHRIEDVLYRNVDRIILMDEGKIVADKTPQELLCTDELVMHGLREPFYVAALKEAGVSLSVENQLQRIDTLSLSENQIDAVKRWFSSSSAFEKKEKSKKILEVNNISFSYGKKENVLNNISFSISEGEMVSICGKNGAGKTTISKLICGFERLNTRYDTYGTGSILFEGNDITNLSIKERAEHIGYVMQNPNQMLCKPMIFDEVAMGLRTRKIPEEEIKDRVYEALKICGLYSFRNWPVSALSFGQKKRVTIASMLVLKPKLLILDEPTAGQDFYHYTEIMEFLKSLNNQGYTIVLITHDMHLMLEYTERSLVFADGSLVADKTPFEVLCDEELIKKASLKETSLFHLSEKCGIKDSVSFSRYFIETDRVKHQKSKF